MLPHLVTLRDAGHAQAVWQNGLDIGLVRQAVGKAHHNLPRFARVVAVADAPAGAGICDDFRPRYAVDIEVMGPDGEPDAKLRELEKITY